MPEPADLLSAWQDAIRQLGRATSSLTGAPAELLEQAMRRQADFEKELAGRMLAPVGTVIEALEQAAEAMHTQAEAFAAASKAFKQAGELVEVQAQMLDRTTQALKAPAELVRSVRDGGSSKKKGSKKR
jgi:DNA anti-recombination protein RmuC